MTANIEVVVSAAVRSYTRCWQRTPPVGGCQPISKSDVGCRQYNPHDSRVHQA